MFLTSIMCNDSSSPNRHWIDSKKSAAAVVLGGYVNGYSIIQELYTYGVQHIILLAYGKELASYSNKLTKTLFIGRDKESLYRALLTLHTEYQYLVLYPTNDLQIEQLKEFETELSPFSYLPFNTHHVLTDMQKLAQYEACQRLNIPCPCTWILKCEKQFTDDRLLQFPYMIKPNVREDLHDNTIFRNKIIYDKAQLDLFLQDVKKNGWLNDDEEHKGMKFIVSEIIPGTTNGRIFAYTACRTPQGDILGEWIGTKLSQHPNDYGVFASASNQAPPIIKQMGRKLIEGMDLYGICEPEFKLDSRDGQYKLMEINLRSMMWHRVGLLSGIPLHYLQWCYVTGLDIPTCTTDTNGLIHLIYLRYEVLNCLFRKKYLRYFFHNICMSGKMYFALFDKHDMKPFIVDLLHTMKLAIIRLLKYKQYVAIYNM